MKKWLTGVLPVCLASCLLLASCTQPADDSEKVSEGAPTEATSSVAQTSPAVDDALFDEYDKNGEPDVSGATAIAFASQEISVDGVGASVAGTTVTIEKSGVYTLSGTLQNGQVVVNTKDSGIVWLVLQNADLHCSNSAALYIQKAERAIVTLANGTQNALSDEGTYVFDDTEKEEPSATLFSKSDLTINGSGSLCVNAMFRDGVVSKDALKIASGNIQVCAVDDGLIGRDYVAIGGGELKVEAEGDAVKSTNDADDTVGFVRVCGGTLDLSAGTDGIQAVSAVEVTGGTLSVKTAGGSESVKEKNNSFGMWGNQTDAEDYGSAKGLKCTGTILVSGAVITIDSADDCIHANQTVTVSGGNLSLSSGDDGIHADDTLTVSGGTVTIKKSYEGLEATDVTISGGEISIVSSDDGINCAGGNDGSAMGRPGAGSFGGSNAKLTISGGSIFVDASGDGLDSNGSIVMTDGHVTVVGPNSNDNDALDYDGSFSMSGGVLVAISNGGMAQTPSENTQNAIVWNGASIGAGDEICLTDQSGTVIASATAVRSARWVYVSTPQITAGETYSFSAGQSSETVTAENGLASIGTSSGFGGGMGGRPNMGF